jgi:hypothetical protein
MPAFEAINYLATDALAIPCDISLFAEGMDVEATSTARAAAVAAST